MDLSFIIEGLLAGTSRPWVRDGERGDEPGGDLAELGRRGVAGIVSLTESPLDREAVARAGFDYLHLPVRDFGAPSMKDVRRFVDFVRWVRREREGAVAVHCGSGCGRTGTMLACFLVAEGNSAAEAMAEVRRTRPGSIETDGQEEAVRAWENEVSPRRHGEHGDGNKGTTNGPA